MPSVNDWAAKAAREILNELHRTKHSPTEARVAAIIVLNAAPILELVRERRNHYHCDDSWYCCGKCLNLDHQPQHMEDYLASHDGEAARVGGVCNCGADAWNERVDKALNGPNA